MLRQMTIYIILTAIKDNMTILKLLKTKEESNLYKFQSVNSVKYLKHFLIKNILAKILEDSLCKSTDFYRLSLALNLNH